LGSTGPDVAALQSLLISKSYLAPGNTSGYFGLLTKAALAKLQCDAKLICGGDAGSLGPKTLSYLNGTALPLGTPLPSSLPQPAYVPPASSARILKLGDVGEDVRALQVFLNTHGYPIANPGEQGGAGREVLTFGLKTQEALMRFQRANSIVPASGIYGPVTRGRVESMR